MDKEVKDDLDNAFIWKTAPFPTTPTSDSINASLLQYELSSLQCYCCRSLYDNPVTLRPCHHTFCSQCIRGHFSTRNGVKSKRDCPICHSKIEMQKNNGGYAKPLDDEDAIIPNHGLRKVVDEYKQMRSKLYSSLVELQNFKDKHSSSNATGEASTNGDVVEEKKRSATNSYETPMKRPRRACSSRSDISYKDETIVELDRDVGEEKKDSSDVVDLTQDNDSKKVEPKKRLEHKHFNLAGKKRKDLIAMCKAEGIDSSGTDLELKARLKRFADYWRSECDREFHRPEREVKRTFNKEEKTRLREEVKLKNSREKVYTGRLNQSRTNVGKSDDQSGKVTSGNGDFDDKLKTIYRTMMLKLCKAKGFACMHDMVVDVCTRKNENIPQNLPAWTLIEDEDALSNTSDADTTDEHSNEDSKLSAASTSSINPHSSNRNTQGRGDIGKEASRLSGTSTSIANPYSSQSSCKSVTTSKIQIANPYSTQSSCKGVTTSKIQTNSQKGPTVSIDNPYRKNVEGNSLINNQSHESAKTSTPISEAKACPTPVVTDTKPKTNVTTSQKKHKTPSKPNIFQQKLGGNQNKCQNKETKTWTCKTCTFSNEIYIWSKKRKKCGMCFTPYE